MISCVPRHLHVSSVGSSGQNSPKKPQGGVSGGASPSSVPQYTLTLRSRVTSYVTTHVHLQMPKFQCKSGKALAVHYSQIFTALQTPHDEGLTTKVYHCSPARADCLLQQPIHQRIDHHQATAARKRTASPGQRRRPSPRHL